MTTMVPGRFTGTRRGYAPTCDITGAVSLDHKHTPSLSGNYNIVERAETRVSDLLIRKRQGVIVRHRDI